MNADPSSISFDDLPEGRYDRQEMISWWDQDLLAGAHVIVAGAGALGNEVLKLLALVGVGRITVVDFDVVSPSNLARMVLFRESDLGRPKAEVAARRLLEINPHIRVQSVLGDLRFDLGLGDYRSADLVFGCLDSVQARWELNRRCQKAGVEWIDAGISDFHGLVARYVSGKGACYECTFSQATWERFNRRYSCPYGLLEAPTERPVPTTAPVSSALAAMQVQQGLLSLHHRGDEGLQPGERLMLYLKPFRLVQDKLPFNHACLAHETLPSEIPHLSLGLETSLAEVIIAAREFYPFAQALELDYDLVASFFCPFCSVKQSILRPRQKVTQAEAACPVCGSLRQVELVSSIDLESPLAVHSLKELGIPSNEVLTLSGGGHEGLVQLVAAPF